uniref:Integrin linked kinase n=1 Tax=Myotis myotis TaxID=51298 RepID=A0A7J7VHQ7_MYOMY|nr:integrin linked kinase [Myotis myotis]
MTHPCTWQPVMGTVILYRSCCSTKLTSMQSMSMGTCPCTMPLPPVMVLPQPWGPSLPPSLALWPQKGLGSELCHLPHGVSQHGRDQPYLSQ